MTLRSLRALLVTLAPAAFAGSLVGYSPIGCGCVDIWEAVANELRLPTKEWSLLTADAVQGSLDRNLRGQLVSLESLPLGEGSCAARSATTFVCTYWLWSNGATDKGLRATVTTDRAGRYRSAKVIEVDRKAKDPRGVA